MSDIKLYRIKDLRAAEILGTADVLEKSLQSLIEKNLEPLLRIRLLASEHSTGEKHRGRIDSLGIDENSNPVIIEYKRTKNENVINQGLFYLDWLLDHKADFQILVTEKLGADAGEKIDWSAPRLLCIAEAFTRYDEHAIHQIDRNIELFRYRRFGEELLMLELVNASEAESGSAAGTVTGPSSSYKTISETLDALQGPLHDLYHDLRTHLLALGDDVQEKTLKYYVAFKRIHNFVCIEVHPNKGALTLFLKVDPTTVNLQKGFSRDVRTIGHYGTGDLELTLRDQADLKRAEPYIERSYDAS
ncbi:MAG: DUF91 domain-containing protein [Gammaproteobacteria bacterium]|nr:DUF91 domain-containing protein [Gammaproteobacteria bacterium]MYF67332.1 DUF91 domain-containing protein [Gammaproteobacteria bacterium]MYK36765.1 DUF91 domain-containing protein [Gammaproteobacteria bacterium]